MRTAVSNIAWPQEIDSICLDILLKNDVRFLEIAPTKFWPDLKSTTSNDVSFKKSSIEDLGFQVIAAQSLLFGKPELSIFGPDTSQTFEYLKCVIDICSNLGCKNLVFGSPKNRLKDKMTFQEACDEAGPLFKKISEYCLTKNIYFCIEANAPQYGCDFVTNIDEGIYIVEKVNHSNFALHLDIGNMIMAGENVEMALSKGFPYANHLHISAPNLAPIYHLNNHLNKKTWNLLCAFPYYLSVEMLIKDGNENIPKELEKSLVFLNNQLCI
jgi:D-psicose/D-tagatose/L-ribulose 3-epimerase